MSKHSEEHNKEHQVVVDRAELARELGTAKRTDVDRQWSKYMDYYLGNHWGKQTPDNPKPITNYTQKICTDIVALKTDIQPRLTVEPFDKGDLDTADFVKNEILAIWNLNDCGERLDEAELDAVIIGDGFWKAVYNKDTKQIEIYTVSPKYLYPAPGATSLKRIPWMLERIPYSVDAFLAEFPEYAEKVLPTEVDPLVLKGFVGKGLETYRKFDAFNFQDTTGGKVSRYVLEESEMTKRVPTIWLNELWYWSPDSKDYRVSHTVGLVFLDDKLNDRHRKGVDYIPSVPYFQIKNRPVPNSFWSQSEISQIGPLQRDHNVLNAAIQNYIRLVCNTPWIVDTSADIKAERLTNLEALVITKTPGSEVRRDAPPTIALDAFFAVLNRIEMAMDRISGIGDVTQGRSTKGLTAGIAIAELQEAAQVPIRRRARHTQWALKNLGTVIVDYMKVYYKGSRLRRAVAGQGSKLKDSAEIKKIDVGYDCIFDIESSFITSRTARMNQAIQFFGMNLIDKRAVLEDVRYPDREAVLARMAVANATEQALKAGVVPGIPGGVTPVEQVTSGGGTVEETAVPKEILETALGEDRS